MTLRLNRLHIDFRQYSFVSLRLVVNAQKMVNVHTLGTIGSDICSTVWTQKSLQKV